MERVGDLEEPDKKPQSAMTLIKNFKLPRGILARSGRIPAEAASPNNQAKVKRIKKFISTFIVTLVERDPLRS